MSRRRALITAITALLLVLTGAPAALGAGWAKVSGDDVSGIDQAALATVGDRVVAAWPSGQGTDLASSVVVRGWSPTSTGSLAGAGPTTTVARGYSSVSPRPAAVVLPTGMHVVYGGVLAGQARTYITPPLAEGVPSENPQLPIADQYTGTMDALTPPGGGMIVANMTNGDVRTFRDADPGAGVPIHQLLGGPAGYNPSLGMDGAGRVWLAWYSNATGNVGIHLIQLDPATAAPVGQPLKVPQSESPANNGFHLALTCNATTCRIVYGAQASPVAPLRIASWAPGEAGPTDVGGGARLSLGLPLAAAYRADGRLWVAWYDRGSTRGFYAAKLGNARGAGGAVQNLGLPAGAAFLDARNLEAVARGNDLAIAGTVLTTAPRASLWTTYVEDPATAIEDPRTIRNGPVQVVAPTGIAIAKLKRTKCVRVRVSAARPARVLVAIYSGRKSIRLFGQRIVVFKARGKRTVCVRVPFRAKTFNTRTTARIAVAVRTGAKKRKGEPPAKVVTKPFRFFSVR